ncbi:hypothetical protein MYX76_01490 [Desulfobacterota bacterium AH_259_B03_O07]|nr:hypothetical protein [Desulfobacterota bacterium AH_259_B03_O07]
MGLIDQIRNRRDSWTARFEEHRRDIDDENADAVEIEDEEIMRNRKMVGILTPEKEVNE